MTDKKEKEVKYPVFGSNLRQLRLSRNYTQEGLCATLSALRREEQPIKRGAYTMWEGGYSRPEPEIEKLIANFYNTTVDILYNTPLPNAELVIKNGEPPKRLTAFFDAPATAGDSETDMMPVTQSAGYIDTGELFGQCDAAIRIRGNSMLSGYPSGTILGLNRDYDKFFEPGELYVLETRSKRIFKRLYYDPKDRDIIICHSDNQDAFGKGERAGTAFYPDFPVHSSDVLRRMIVVGSAREHSNSLLLYSKPIKDANTRDDIHELDA